MVELPENSLLSIALNEWVTAVLTIVVGGITGSLILPRLQSRYSRFHAREQRRVDIAEQISIRFTRYISSWRRLIQISNLEISRPQGLTKIEADRKERYAKSRSDDRDLLFDSLCSARLFFSNEIRSEINEYMQWDDRNAILTVDKLPPIDEWQIRHDRLIDLFNREIMK